MAFKVIVGAGETIAKALRRLRDLIDEDRPLWHRQRRPFYEKPS
jgi:ribosomal protein S21